MIAILYIIGAVLFGGGLYLFRSMGRMQPPSNAERLRHNEGNPQIRTTRPRATGLD